MKGHQQTPHGTVRQTIIENAQKGETYRIEFHGDAVVYEGVPVGLPGMTSPDEDIFDFRVTAPEDHRGMQRRSVHEVKWLERA
jgi:hypothetical protein